MPKALIEDETKADVVAKLCADLIDPSNEQPYGQLGKKYGFCDKAVKRLHVELMTHYQPTTQELKEITTQELQALVDDKLSMALSYMTPRKFAEAGLRDTAVTFGILAEKRALLRGEPTQIFSIEDSKALKELMPAFLAEAQRRGMDVNKPTLEGDFEMAESHVGARPDPKGARSGPRKHSRKGLTSPLR